MMNDNSFNIIAFVFARGGSKGVPRKNVKLLNNKPLIAYSIEMAKRVPGVDKVYVSTDDNEIADVSVRYGADIIERPAELSTDTASEWMAWRHAVEYLQDQGITFNTFLSLPATSPCRNLNDVVQCVGMLDDQTDMVVTASPSYRNPYYNMITLDNNAYCRVVIEGGTAHGRQDAPITYDMTTVAYVCRPSFILSADGVLAGRTRSRIIPRERSIDIDTAYDFKMAEVLMHEEI